MKVFLLSAVLFISTLTARTQISYTWNGSSSGAWSAPANWTPAGVPGASDNVTIVTGSNTCVLGSGMTINNLIVTSGTLDLSGEILTINGTTATFSSGIVQNGNLVVTSAGTTSFGSGTVTMNCAVTINSATINIRNTTFHGTVNITKTGSTNDSNTGNNTFNGSSTITNAGSGLWVLGNTGPDRFNNTATFNNTGSNHLYVAHNSSNNIFNGVTTFNNSPSANTLIYVSWYSPGTIFNNDIVVNSTNGTGIQFCGGNTTASTTLSSGHTITIGGGGFSSGTFSLRQFTQAGAAPINLTLTGTAEMRFGPAGNFGGPISVNAPDIYTSSSVFNNVTSFTKTDGSTSNATSGGNTFNADLSVNYISSNGTGYWSFGNGNPDIYNGDVYANNNSLNRIIFGHNSTNNQFNGNFIITQTGSSTGTALTWNNGSTAVMAAGKTISVGGAGLSAGYFYIQGLTQNGNAPVNITATGTSSIYVGAGNTFNPSVMGGNFSVTAPDIYVRGATFNRDVFITKTGGVNNHNDSKPNVFNGNLTIDQQSNSGYFMLGYNTNDQFNEDITLSSTGTGGISLGWTSGTGNPVLAAGKTIAIGSGGYNAGYLQLGGFSQTGSTPINLNLTGTSSFYVVNPGTACSFDGALTVTAPDIYIRGGIFNNAATFTKTGGVNNHNSGNQNNFNGLLTINQQSSTGYFMLGYNSNDLFNDDITVTSTGSGGINFGFNTGTGAPNLAAGKTISVGGAGFSDGYLNLYAFTQAGTTPINLPFTGTNTIIRFARNSVIGGNLVVSSPDIYFDGCTFNGTVDATKTGTRTNTCRGGNIFNAHCSITNNGSNYLMLGNSNPDIWNDDVVFTNSGSERILTAWSTAGNQFNGNVYLNTSGSATGIHFSGGNSTASATLAAGRTIQAGSGGLNAGYVILRQFTQLGNTPINLTLGNTATYLQFGPSSAIGGNLTSSSPGLFFNGCTFSGTVNAVKTGTTNDASSGKNIFNGISIITNAGSGYLLMGNGNEDVFNAAATFNNTGTNNLHVAYNSSNNIFAGVTTFNNTPAGNNGIYVSSYSTGTLFNENIIVTSTNGAGVQFCSGNSTATTTLAANKTIGIGGAGFSSGTLLLKQFTQAGTTSQNLTLTGTGSLVFGPDASFGGTVTSSSPGLNFNGGTFNGVVYSVKNGISNDLSRGNNLFNATSTFINNGSGYLLMTNAAPDTYNADVTFIKNGAGAVYPNYNQNGNYAGNVNISSSTAITFGTNTGTAIFTGTSAQNISVVSGTPTPVFRRLVINNTSSGVTLSNTPVNVSVSLVLASGLLHTSPTYILTMQNNATVAAGNALSTSYVNGPMRYQKSSSGSTTLNFPVGNGSDCRPVAITVNHTNGTLYTYQTQLFNASAAALGYTLPTTINTVSTVHYYTIGRTDASGNNQPTNGLSGNQIIEIFFGLNDQVTDGNAISVVKNTYNATSSWIDVGGTGGPPYAGGINLTGSITSTSSPTAFNSFSTFAIGFRVMAILPVDLLDFSAKANNNYVDLEWKTKTESGNNFFTVEKSNDGINFETLQVVNTNAINGNSQSELYYLTQDLNPYTGRNYYRLKQTDIDGKFTYSKVVTVSFDKKQSVSVYPNPAVNTVYIKGLEINSTRIEWYDMGGRIVATQVVTVQNGMAKLNTNIANGVYILKFAIGKGVWGAERIIIRR